MKELDGLALAESMGWKHYRTMLNDLPARFCVNMDCFTSIALGNPRPEYHNLAQLELFYSADEHKLPLNDEYARIFLLIFKLIVQLETIRDRCYYAGHIFCDGRVSLYIYCKDPQEIFEIGGQFEEFELFYNQEDPKWDMYFDYLMPSNAEVRANATEEMLNFLEDTGNDLSQIYTIEHSFHFYERDNMVEFMDAINDSEIALNAVSYSRDRVHINEAITGEAGVYLVRIEQEMPLDTSEIYEMSETLDKYATDHQGFYMGWQPEDRKGIVMH